MVAVFFRLYWHELLGSTGYWLIGAHAAAGLFHHYWVRDNTLVRILPGRSGNAVNPRQR
ncbi:cytochrome b561 [Pseudomonas lini]|nr:cytochrome b561 [Pseudomonas lini]